MSHLSDAQEISHYDMTLQDLKIHDNHINFAKYIIMQCKGDLTIEIDVDLFWTNYVKSKSFNRD